MNQETKHTSGPWNVVGEQIQSKELNAYGNWIVVTCQRELTAQDKANLNLIAAAPDLLKALEQITSTYEKCDKAIAPSLKRSIIDSRAAIAKANPVKS